MLSGPFRIPVTPFRKGPDRLQAEFFSRSRASKETGRENGSDSMMKRFHALAKEVEAPSTHKSKYRANWHKRAQSSGGRLMDC